MSYSIQFTGGSLLGIVAKANLNGLILISAQMYRERQTWRCAHCKTLGTTVWQVRDGPAGPRVSLLPTFPWLLQSSPIIPSHSLPHPTNYHLPHAVCRPFATTAATSTRATRSSRRGSRTCTRMTGRSSVESTAALLSQPSSLRCDDMAVRRGEWSSLRSSFVG